MLLHVIESPDPIYAPFDRPNRERPIELVRDPIVFVDYIKNSNSAERPYIERLASGRGIKGGAVEICDQPTFPDVDNIRREITQVAVVIVETFGHFTLP
jgi:hypothetical protein